MADTRRQLIQNQGAVTGLPIPSSDVTLRPLLVRPIEEHNPQMVHVMLRPLEQSVAAS